MFYCISLVSQNSNLAIFATDRVSTEAFSSDQGTTKTHTLNFTNLLKQPTKAIYVPDHEQWATQVVSTITINNNSVTVSLTSYGFMSTNYARVGGRLIYW